MSGTAISARRLVAANFTNICRCQTRQQQLGKTAKSQNHVIRRRCRTFSKIIFDLRFFNFRFEFIFIFWGYMGAQFYPTVIILWSTWFNYRLVLFICTHMKAQVSRRKEGDCYTFTFFFFFIFTENIGFKYKYHNTYLKRYKKMHIFATWIAHLYVCCLSTVQPGFDSWCRHVAG